MKLLGLCDLCREWVYEAADGTAVRKQGGGRPPETPHRHRKPYSVHKPEPEADLYEHGWRGWMDVADRMGAL